MPWRLCWPPEGRDRLQRALAAAWEPVGEVLLVHPAGGSLPGLSSPPDLVISVGPRDDLPPSALVLPGGIGGQQLVELAVSLARWREVAGRSPQGVGPMGEVLDDVAAVLVHDVRTPLTVLKGHVQMLREELLGPLQPRQAHAVEVLDRQLGRLEGQLDHLQGALLPARRVRPGPLVPVDLPGLVRRVAREMGLAAQVEGGGTALAPLPGLELALSELAAAGGAADVLRARIRVEDGRVLLCLVGLRPETAALSGPLSSRLGLRPSQGPDGVELELPTGPAQEGGPWWGLAVAPQGLPELCRRHGLLAGRQVLDALRWELEQATGPGGVVLPVGRQGVGAFTRGSPGSGWRDLARRFEGGWRPRVGLRRLAIPVRLRSGSWSALASGGPVSYTATERERLFEVPDGA